MKALLLYNPTAGRGKIEYDLAGMTSYMASLNIDFETKASLQVGDLKDYAKHIKDDIDVVLVAGGDGSISEVVSGLMTREKKPALLPLPYGSANDIAHILGIPKNYQKAFDLIVQQKPVSMDLNQINAHYFVYTTAVGLFTRVSYDIKRHLLKKYGPLAYYVEGLKDIQRSTTFHVDVKTEHDHYQGECALILGLAANRVGGIPLSFIKNSKLNDGLFELRLFEGQKMSGVLRVLLFFLRLGRPTKALHMLKAQSFDIDVPQDLKWNADGEFVTSGKVTLKVLPKALQVYASKKAMKRHF